MTYNDTFRANLAATVSGIKGSLQTAGVLFTELEVCYRAYSISGGSAALRTAGTATATDTVISPRPKAQQASGAGRSASVMAAKINAGWIQDGDITIAGISRGQISAAMIKAAQQGLKSDGSGVVWCISRDPRWAASTAYVVGAQVIPLAARNGRLYRCTVSGTSGGSPPTWPTTAGASVTDGTCTWQEVGADWQEYVQKGFTQGALGWSVLATPVSEGLI